MSFSISFDGWSNSNPKHEDLSGYNAWDFLSGTPGKFETRAQAATWLRSHKLGKDKYGVNAKFKIALR